MNRVWTFADVARLPATVGRLPGSPEDRASVLSAPATAPEVLAA
jgi:hypothetical protein